MSTDTDIAIAQITSKQLNWLIAQLNSPGISVEQFIDEYENGAWNHMYVEDPRHGELLLDLYKIEVAMHRAPKDGFPGVWSACKAQTRFDTLCVGSTRLEAGLRCLAREFFGETVLIPQELQNEQRVPLLMQVETQNTRHMSMRG